MRRPESPYRVVASIIGWCALITAIVFLCLNLSWAWIWGWFILMTLCFCYLIYLAFDQGTRGYGYTYGGVWIIFFLFLLFFCFWW